MVPVRDLDDDYYEFDEKNYCLIGKRRRKIYRLGDPIKIKIARTNIEKKIVDFALVKEDGEENEPTLSEIIADKKYKNMNSSRKSSSSKTKSSTKKGIKSKNKGKRKSNK